MVVQGFSVGPCYGLVDGFYLSVNVVVLLVSSTNYVLNKKMLSTWTLNKRRC